MDQDEALVAIENIRRTLSLAKAVIEANLANNRQPATCTPTCNANLVPGMPHNCALGVRAQEIVDSFLRDHGAAWLPPANKQEIANMLISASNSGLLSLWERS